MLTWDISSGKSVRSQGGLVSLSLQSRRVGDIVVVRCRGRIVEGPACAELQEQLGRVLPDDPCIILDLSDVDFLDSSGLGRLVRFLSRSRAANGDIKLCGVPARISEVLRITRLAAVFDSHASEADAVAAFYRQPVRAGAPNRFNPEILCVDKSRDVLTYVCEALRQSGYGVMFADNLPDALILLKASRPKAVVVSAELRAARDTGTAQAFNELATRFSVIELPADFSSRDAAEAGERLLDQVRAVIGPRETGDAGRVSV
jgi:anti-sigma B factor antagonist